jgi:uncharacterized Zn finger protein
MARYNKMAKELVERSACPKCGANESHLLPLAAGSPIARQCYICATIFPDVVLQNLLPKADSQITVECDKCGALGSQAHAPKCKGRKRA